MEFYAQTSKEYSPPLEDIVLFRLFPSGFPSRFLKPSTRERFPHPYKECFVLLPNRCAISQSTPPSMPSVLASTRSLLQSMWDPPIQPPSEPSILGGTPPRVHPLQVSASSLAHRPVSDSDTICNSPSPPLADIILFGLSLSSFRKRFPHPVKNTSFSSQTDVGSHIQTTVHHEFSA